MSSQTNWKTLMLLFFREVLTRVINMILLILTEVCFCKNKIRHYLVSGSLELERSLWTTIQCVYVCMSVCECVRMYVCVLYPFILRSLLSLQKIFFDSLLLAMCNGTTCAQVHELPRKHCWDNQEGRIVFMILYKMGKLYLLPNIHKSLSEVPGRPVVSNCGTLMEIVSEFLDSKLKSVKQEG